MALPLVCHCGALWASFCDFQAVFFKVCLFLGLQGKAEREFCAFSLHSGAHGNINGFSSLQNCLKLVWFR